MSRLALFVVLLVVAACSNRSIYESLQTQQRNECMGVHPAEYDECMERVRTSYEAYRRAREEALAAEGDSQPEITAAVR